MKNKKESAFSLFLESVKEAKEYNKLLKKLELASIDYGAIQEMIDRVSERNVKVIITRPDGHTLVIEPRSQEEMIGYKSFKERVDEARKQRI